MIVVQHLTKRFGAQMAVDALSFEVPAGQILGFLGPNGAGKSTTLKMLTGMLEPTSGTATICGFDLLREPLEVKRRVGMVPESGAVFESLTGLEYLEMVAALYAIPPEPARARIRQFIAFFDLSFETLTDKLLGAYSKGMRRKVVITAALLHNPPVVFFDEPLDGLDANAAVGFKALIQTLAHEGKTIVYSSHILDVVERVCDRVIIIDKGRLLVDGRPDELVASHGTSTLEKLFTQLTGGSELESRAADFAKTFPAMSPSAGQGVPPIQPNSLAGTPVASPSRGATPPLTPERTLRRLFLTLFLRGRSSRGLQKDSAPKSVGRKLAMTLVWYALFGLFALFFHGQTVFALSVYLHGMTFVFLGMFVAASAGEVLFNKEEADILLHRPITPRALLAAKIGVLVQVSLWLAGAFNLGGLFIGVTVRDGGWAFPLAHALSTCIEALFTTACVVLTYQLCLRWFGRERLEGLMTAAQMFVAVAAVLAGQILPRMLGGLGGKLRLSADTWWLSLLPPAWFAGLDDALAGSRASSSWALAAWGLAATGLVLWLAFGKLAQDYGTGLQTLGEARTFRPRQTARRRWLAALVALPPLRWWLRDSVSRAGFLLTAAYLLRDRDMKLRVYPTLASMLVMPVIMMVQGRGSADAGSGFSFAFAGMFLGIIPVMGLNLVQYSQHWQAADLFRAAPIAGPAPLCHGARRAVLCLLTLPVLLLLGLFAWLLGNPLSNLALLLPGALALPVFALLPGLGGHAVPLSMPTEEAKSASRGLSMLGVMLVSGVLSGLAAFAWSGGWFGWLLLVELIALGPVYAGLRASISAARWPSLE